MVAEEETVIVVRQFDAMRDRESVEFVEKRCEVGPCGKLAIYTDLHGDPICRVRHSPAFLMLVAEINNEIVGMVRGCIKTVTCGRKLRRNSLPTNNLNPIYAKAAYILGLRVSPSHSATRCRRLGVGLKLVQSMEEWFRSSGAEYSYMATENDNHASIQLFTQKCGYSKFRTPSILVNPVFAHRVPVPKSVSIFRLSPRDAEDLYRRRFSTTEFFPRDIDAVLNNRLNLGTFVAVPQSYGTVKSSEAFLRNPPESWAMTSVWNCKDVFTLEVRGVSLLKRVLARTTRAFDRALPFLRLPSVPEIFRPFGLHFMYGLGGEGKRMREMARALCAHAHNMAKEGGCGVLATEVSSQDPLKEGIPHWKMLSCSDLWCVKRLSEDYSEGSVGDWTKAVPGLSIFVDPREF